MSPNALIVGAGPAGLSAALHLAGWCRSVTVAEARPRTALRHTGEHLPPAGLAALIRLGFGPLLDDARHQISSGVTSAWGSEIPADKEYFFTPTGSGRNLHRTVFDAALIDRAERRGVRLAFGTRLQALGRRAEGFDATLRGPAQTASQGFDIVLDATGRNARAARLLGARARRIDRMVGLSAEIPAQGPQDDAGRLHIEALENGWCYGARLSTGALLCTFMTDAATLAAHPGGAHGLWRAALEQTRSLAPLTGTALADTGTPEVQVFDAATQSVPDLDIPGFACVGDAACAYDPLSSWGITKGMLDGHHTAEALRHQRSGAPDALRRHHAARRADYRTYHQHRAALYRAERRWPNADFWQRRHRAPAAD